MYIRQIQISCLLSSQCAPAPFRQVTDSLSKLKQWKSWPYYERVVSSLFFVFPFLHENPSFSSLTNKYSRYSESRHYHHRHHLHQHRDKENNTGTRKTKMQLRSTDHIETSRVDTEGQVYINKICVKTS
jgi:hypothetical protein